MNPKPVEASGALVRFDICLFVPLIQKEGWVQGFLAKIHKSDCKPTELVNWLEGRSGP